MHLTQNNDERLTQAREHMLRQLRERDITDTRILEVFQSVPRESFVLPQDAGSAYEDYPLPIGFGQTISQPYIVAYMVSKLRLKPSDRVLEIGTGSGYAAAIISKLAAKVFTVEVVPELYERAKATLKKLHYTNVICYLRDGRQGIPEEAPFDKIMLSAAPEQMPSTLLDQLKLGGLLIAPVGSIKLFQQLRLYEKTGPEKYKETDLLDVSFVEMV
ncbi:MAG: protein-L-isoaspartate(D-aspartate) O-methyltransferase [Candidatus Komeilibacteria bacterium]|nr:protein-L-isoaspartate(D-aspartate) O-methyltransferase [Candidatus Komeilibacteria bacterium]